MGTERGRVDIGRLKAFALRALSRGSALRELILAEREGLEAGEFIAKLDDWLRLLDLEAGASHGRGAR